MNKKLLAPAFVALTAPSLAMAKTPQADNGNTLAYSGFVTAKTGFVTRNNVEVDPGPVMQGGLINRK